ncbi:MAG: hypothetical protein LBK53_02430 [Heliobacteriaceae bacterium]|jgi:hypothetical protein|nr:hypothetical protein [Heliobacteriaceae bacterium]
MLTDKVGNFKMPTQFQILQNPPQEKQNCGQKPAFLSNPEKYMIGAAILAGTIAIGIIGHKNNWWRKAAKVIEENKNSTENIPNYNYTKTEIENGYTLQCNKTGKKFTKMKDAYGNIYTYERRLENGNTIKIHKHTQEYIRYGKRENAPITRTEIFNKEENPVYQSFYEAATRMRTEYIYNYDTMTAYEVKVVNAFGARKVCEKRPFEIKSNGLSLLPEEKMEYTEFENIRKQTLDKLLPKSYNRLKSKFIRQFSHKMSNTTTTLESIDDNGSRHLTKKTSNGCKLSVYKYANKEETYRLDTPFSLDHSYECRKDKLKNGFVEFEMFQPFSGKDTYRKFFDGDKKQYIYEYNKNAISKEEFSKARLEILSGYMPQSLRETVERFCAQ